MHAVWWRVYVCVNAQKARLKSEEQKELSKDAKLSEGELIARASRQTVCVLDFFHHVLGIIYVSIVCHGVCVRIYVSVIYTLTNKYSSPCTVCMSHVSTAYQFLNCTSIVFLATLDGASNVQVPAKHCTQGVMGNQGRKVDNGIATFDLQTTICLVATYIHFVYFSHSERK